MTSTGELEARLLAEPDDPAAWAVYADWLIARGDPDGELIQLELAIEAAHAARRAPEPELATRYAALAREGPSRWAPNLVTDERLSLEWRRAAPYLARVSSASVTDTRASLEPLLAHERARFLVELQLDLSVARDDLDVLPSSLWIDGHGQARLPSLRTLDVDVQGTLGRTRPLVDLGLDWATAFPQLRELALRSPALHMGATALAHPRLRKLVLSMRDGFDRTAFAWLADAKLPALEQLRVWGGRFVANDEKFTPQLERLLGNPSFARLYTLGLNAFSLTPTMLDKLVNSPLLARLVRLELAWCTIGDESLPMFWSLVRAAPQLCKLVLRGNYLSPLAAEELSTRFPARLVIDRQKHGDDRQLPVFGRYGVSDRMPMD